MQEAIKIGLDNSEVVRVISIGAQGIPIGGFEPDAPVKPVATPRPVEGMPAEVWSLSLGEAIRIGLENSAVVRMVKPGDEGLPLGGFGADAPPPALAAIARPLPAPSKLGPGRDADAPKLVIARAKADVSTWRFQADVQAHVRSIEQQYWALGQQTVVVWAREIAVKIGEEILKRERAEADNGHIHTADVAEAEQQLENFKLNLVSATSDLITTERQLRNLLGLPPSDNRRIVPSTAPIEAKVDPIWEDALATMTSRQPEILDQLLLMQRASDDARGVARTEAQAAGQEEVLRQVIHKSTHALARYFLEVDANHKLYRAAMKSRAAAQARLEAQRTFYDEGRITPDRLLDAVSQYANAIARESQHLTTYNSSIASLEEAKGTLLSFDGITVAEYAPKAEKPAADPKLAPASFDPKPQPTPTTYKLRVRITGGDLFEIDVEVRQSKKPSPPAVEPGR